jgi:hypothetical protein
MARNGASKEHCMNRHERRRDRKVGDIQAPQLFMEPVSARHSETGRDELYLTMSGHGRVAYRGHPGTAEAGKWISLVPDFKVVDEHPDDGVPVFDAGVVELFPEPNSTVQSRRYESIQ